MNWSQGRRKPKCPLGDEKSHPPPGVKTDQLSQSFVIISDTKFPDIVMKTAYGVVFLKVLFALLHNLVR
jgi:hypothetical protein